MLNRSISAVVAGLLLVAGNAAATLVDFSSSAFSGASGAESFTTTIEGVGVTVLEARPVGAELTQTSDGLGVDSPNWNLLDDASQLGVPERIIVTFDNAQFIEEVYVAQLFRESGWLGTINETGWFSIDGGDQVEFHASGDANGQLSIAVGAEATSITFGAKLAGGSHDYSLSGLNLRTISAAVTAIPEPISTALLGIGGIVVGAAVRRRII